MAEGVGQSMRGKRAGCFFTQVVVDLVDHEAEASESRRSPCRTGCVYRSVPFPHHDRA